MKPRPVVFPISLVFVIGMLCTASAADVQPAGCSAPRIRLLEEKPVAAVAGSAPGGLYSLRELGCIFGARRLALPESGHHVLLLTSQGTVWAWGENRAGQLGAGDAALHPGWVEVANLDEVVAVAAGAFHSVALKQDGTVWVWGDGSQGQSGDGSLVGGPVARRVPGVTDAVAIAAGMQYTMALRRDGTVWVWGSNWQGMAPGLPEKLISVPVRAPRLEQVDGIFVLGNRPHAHDSQGRQWVWGMPDVGPRPAPMRTEATLAWPELVGRERSVQVSQGALVVQEVQGSKRIETARTVLDVQAGWALGWIEDGDIPTVGTEGQTSAATPLLAESTMAPLAATNATTTALSTLPNPSVFGAAVTLKATVTQAAASGKVTFYDGASVIGVAALASGSATLQTSLLPAGGRQLRAYYGGDALYLPSASASVVQSVNAIPGNGFSRAVNYGVGSQPDSVAVGDFNGDGKADLAVANGAGGNVSVLLGNGNGTFQAARTYWAGTNPTSVAAGDFNGDGKPDLAVANPGSNKVSLLLNNGNGIFQSAVSYGAGAYPYSIAVGDFNGDGKTDLAVANYLSYSVSVLLGRGDGTLQAPMNYGVGSYPLSVAVADFDGDGRADLAVANSSSFNLSVLLGRGDGTFQTAVNYGLDTYPNSVIAADLNGDNKADLAVAIGGSNTIGVLFGNGNGTFQAAVNYGQESAPFSLAVGDFNGDRNADLAVASWSGNSVSVSLGNKSGTFQAAVSYGAGTNPGSVAVSDFNGDGRADLAVANVGSNTVSVFPGSASVITFIKQDSTTQGTWKGVYGTDGFSVANNATSYPSYVVAAATGGSPWTWSPTTPDVRALQQAGSGTQRTATTFYTADVMTFDLPFPAAATHQFAIYCLDWDGNGIRSQRIEILDPSNNQVLDTRTLTNFASGMWLVWNVSGHIALRITNTSGSNAVVSGLFFDPPAVPPGAQIVTFVKQDLATQGTWKGVYGTDGYNVVNNATSYPSYVVPAGTGNSPYTWSAATTDVRALQQAGSGTQRTATAFYTGDIMTFDLPFPATARHQFAIYCLDWDGNGSRGQRIDVLDPSNNQVLDTRTLTGFSSGTWLVWSVSGHIALRITRTAGANAVVSGLFFDSSAAASTAPIVTFVRQDMAAQGTWRGTYGIDGYTVVNNETSYPWYVAPAGSGNVPYTWAAATTDLRALQQARSGTQRIAAAFYASNAMTFDLPFPATAAHQFAIYCLDWDGNGSRGQKIEILDPSNDQVLDTRMLTNFSSGTWLVWNVSGHIVLRLTRTAGSNAVISGLFFGPAAGPAI
jgi:hypothetical protein